MRVILFCDRVLLGYQFKVIEAGKCRFLQPVRDLAELPCSRGILESAVRMLWKIGNKGFVK